MSARTAEFTALFGSTLAECKGAKTTASCAGITCATAYDAAKAGACMDKLAPLTCAQVGDEEIPTECDEACP
jgi:hypothetical protein